MRGRLKTANAVPFERYTALVLLPHVVDELYILSVLSSHLSSFSMNDDSLGKMANNIK
jgi:hypothetical protein